MTLFKTLPFIALLAATAGTAVAHAGPSRSAADSYRTISVTGRGEAFGKPDQAEINVGVETFAETAVEASRKNQAVVDRIMEALERQGIEPKDIRTTQYRIWAPRDYDEEKEEDRVTGYRVANILRITAREISKVGEVLAAVTNAGANSINGIRFMVSDTDALKSKAREKAMVDARAQAEALARLAGVKLGDVLTLSTSTATQPPQPVSFGRARGIALSSAPEPGISSGQQSVSVSVYATYAIR